MTKLFSLELSDGLHELRGLLADFTHEPRILAPEDARALVECCAVLERKARELECDLDKLRWNNAARQACRQEMRRVLAEATGPGSNVTLFPVVHRPVMTDRSDGGAA